MPDFPDIPSSTILGRTSPDVGPAQALPFNTLQNLVNILYDNQVNDGTVSSGTAVISVSAGPRHLLTVGGAITVAFVGWPSPPAYAEVEVQLVNGGLGVTWPTVHWLKGDGTNSTTFSAMGIGLNNPGTNFVIVWSADGGTTLFGRAA